VQKSAGKVLDSIFLESRWHHHHHGLLSKGPDYQRGVLLISAGLVAVACFLLDRAKDLSAPRYIGRKLQVTLSAFSRKQCALAREIKTKEPPLATSTRKLITVRRYIESKRSCTYTADDLDGLLEQAEHQRVMMISDKAGMGKSTVLTHLSKQIKQKIPAKWVVRFDLNDHTDALKALQQEQIDKEKSVELISEKVLQRKPGRQLELFKQCCEQWRKVRIVVMLDGFDEISPICNETVIDLLQALRQTSAEQLWVTIRPHPREELGDNLQQLPYKLEPFSVEDQVEL
jgi:hypothetical protein